jgi:hypothetical protein
VSGLTQTLYANSATRTTRKTTVRACRMSIKRLLDCLGSPSSKRHRRLVRGPGQREARSSGGVRSAIHSWNTAGGSAFTTSCRKAVPTDLVLDQESRFYIYLDVPGRGCTRPRRRILYCRRDLVNGGDARIKQTTRRLSWTSYAGLAEVRNRLAFFRV